MRKIPYGRQLIDDADIQAVTETLKSDYLTTGPKIREFEDAVARYCGASFGVAVANGTAALHAAMFALGIGPGDEVIVPSITFAATANCVLYMGGTPIFADVDSDTLLIDPASVEQKISNRTKAIIGVDYAGQPCEWDSLKVLADKAGAALIADGCHALGASYKNINVGCLADMTVFSFHPVKHVATGEGGMITTDNETYNGKLRLFRNHGISTDAHERDKAGDWYYEMIDLGYNYRMTDIQAALGVSQMKKLPESLNQRRTIARAYDEAFSDSPALPLSLNPNREHAYHLYVIRTPDRDNVFRKLRQDGIGAQVHYIPVHLHPYYRHHLGTQEGQCPVAEEAYRQILSLPMFPGLSKDDQAYVIASMQRHVKS